MVEIPDELKIYIPDFEYLLYDLSKHSDEQLKNMAGLSIGLLLLKYIFDEGEFTKKLEKIISLFKELENQENILEYFRTIIRYVLNAANGVSMSELKNIIDIGLSTEKGGEVMTIAEQLRQEGMQKGRQKGRQEGRQEGKIEEAREFILDVIDTRFGVVPMDIKNQIESIENIELLKKFLKDAVRVKSVHDFSAILAETDINKH